MPNLVVYKLNRTSMVSEIARKNLTHHVPPLTPLGVLEPTRIDRLPMTSS